jgi:DNA-binding transcriptional MerR regulator
MRQRYSSEIKDSLIAKIMSRGTRTIGEVCRQEGVTPQSIHSWMRKRAKVAGMKKPNEIKKWSAEDKLKALIDTSALAESDFGVYLRKEGLYSHQVAEWRTDVLKSLDVARARPQAPKRDDRDVRIKELEYNLARMEKALAEASARMMLQKKADLFWAERELRMKK